MELTHVQRRTLEGLIGTGERPTFPGDLAQRLRDRLEEAVRGLDLAEPLWLGKEKLNDAARCQGLFQAGLLGEKPPFEHRRKSAVGTLLHKAIELDVASREDLAPHELVEAAVERLEEDAAFTAFWRDRDQLTQDEILMEAAKALDVFRATFPPLRPLRRELAPSPEARVRAELHGGALTLSGQIDLVLGRHDPVRATRLAIDLKTQGAWPEYPEDMRFYALLLTLRFGVPPYRVATVFLESGEWQAEDVSDRTLEHAADRVIGAARTAAALAGGRPPELNPGHYCRWCPRQATCPAAAFGEPPPEA